ncbi:hypothetical protein [Achromobacter insuavis]|uniref:hypothetical protein n=1 Tax=Achromobacter insuavis TaxID=1287735 RepID=UPI0035A1D257
MTAYFPRVLPRHALGCYLGAAALLYLFSAQLLAIIDIWLLPRGLLVEMLRYRAMWLVFFLTLPTVGYLLWRGSDLVAWWRAPAALTLDDRALHLGARTVAFSDIASLRHRHNRDHLLRRAGGAGGQAASDGRGRAGVELAYRRVHRVHRPGDRGVGAGGQGLRRDRQLRREADKPPWAFVR